MFLNNMQILLCLAFFGPRLRFLTVEGKDVGLLFTRVNAKLPCLPNS